jgi:poly(3-hydroxybutyrate) depolymerase
MTRHILQTHSVDHDRVYVAGLSAGGAMAAILAREYPDLFAAAGVHSGIVPGGASDVASAFAVMRTGRGAAWSLSAFTMPTDAAPPMHGSAPLIVFHGDADTTVAIANADAVLASAIADASLVATTTRGMAATGERAFRRTVWRRDDDADAPSVAEHWVVHGSPHAWSGGDASGSYTDPGGPDASREMLRFFAEHPRAVAVTEAFEASP